VVIPVPEIISQIGAKIITAQAAVHPPVVLPISPRTMALKKVEKVGKKSLATATPTQPGDPTLTARVNPTSLLRLPVMDEPGHLYRPTKIRRVRAKTAMETFVRPEKKPTLARV
jgi:hypothetical protein